MSERYMARSRLMLSGLLLRTLGRRHTIIISAVLFLVSFLCIGI